MIDPLEVRLLGLSCRGSFFLRRRFACHDFSLIGVWLTEVGRRRGSLTEPITQGDSVHESP